MSVLRWLAPTDVPDAPAPDLAASRHRSRQALNAVLHDPRDERMWELLDQTYEEMADGWTEWAAAQRWYLTPLEAGLRRARPAERGLEVGCGTGQAGPVLRRHLALTLATDINLPMVADATRLPGVHYVVADVRRLPVPTASMPLVVGLNAVPHVGEFRRVIAPGGQLLWCSSFGSGTPLYVRPEDLLSLLGPGWTGEAGRAGHGEWALLTAP